MFKPTHFRLKNTIHWPGCGPANELSAENIKKVEDQGENYLFVHASGHAVKVAKEQVTAYGVFDADDVPNLPQEDDYKDGVDGNDDDHGTDSTRLGGNSTPLPTNPIQGQSGDLQDNGPYNAVDYNKQATDAQSDDSIDDSLAADSDPQETADLNAIPPGSLVDDEQNSTTAISDDTLSDAPPNAPEADSELEKDTEESDSDSSDESDDTFNPRFALGKKPKSKRNKK